MNIICNGVTQQVEAVCLAQALIALGFADASVATAVNGVFVPAAQRSAYSLHAGDALEVLAPMQGG
jgi:sulfur carrier protein